MKRLIINADDIGMHPAVDDGVAELVDNGVVRAASVMVLGRPNRDTLTGIARRGASLGLHLDFTSALAHSAYQDTTSLPSLMMSAWGGMLNPTRVLAAVDGQIQRFGELTGRAPDFIDGHEHVHQFPVIRDTLAQVLAARQMQGTHIRITAPRQWRGTKAALIGALGSAALAKRVLKLGCRINGDFAGVYDLTATADLPALWRQWLAGAPQMGGLMMCHPACQDLGREAFRVREFQFLMGAQFRDLCTEFGVQVVNWDEMAGGEGSLDTAGEGVGHG
ncbi:ChbG/HpnK family deacetylase [Pseudoduganella violaceinigra]|uniref:ChbG/HpnK family deacetylase n=1 Tax=Pseudoduganella violaceinigra TaxID=246602 RepID=UPI000487DDFD|nr:ChbG/HpnK family deacetylase [Pseudoduganella violaceinigra]